MKAILFLLILATVVSCDEDTGMRRDSIEYFKKYLREDMEYSDLKSIFGEPDADIGSGIHIYVYNLNNGTQVTIGYTDRILYARHIDEVQVLSELI
jgi:hypothetical protein